MTVLIKGMEMPKRGMVINIYANGRVTKHFDEFQIGTAVPVLPHGRLIDADALKAKFEEMGLGDNSLVERLFADGVYAVIDEAPTIIEADKED